MANIPVITDDPRFCTSNVNPTDPINGVSSADYPHRMEDPYAGPSPFPTDGLQPPPAEFPYNIMNWYFRLWGMILYYFQTVVLNRATTISTSQSTSAAYNIYFVDTAGITLTLSTASLNLGTASNPAELLLKNISGDTADSIIIDTQGAALIDGQSSIILYAGWGSTTFISDGTNWYTKGIVGRDNTTQRVYPWDGPFLFDNDGELDSTAVNGVYAVRSKDTFITARDRGQYITKTTVDTGRTYIDASGIEWNSTLASNSVGCFFECSLATTLSGIVVADKSAGAQYERYTIACTGSVVLTLKHNGTVAGNQVAFSCPGGRDLVLVGPCTVSVAAKVNGGTPLFYVTAVVPSNTQDQVWFADTVDDGVTYNVDLSNYYASTTPYSGQRIQLAINFGNTTTTPELSVNGGTTYPILAHSSDLTLPIYTLEDFSVFEVVFITDKWMLVSSTIEEKWRKNIESGSITFEVTNIGNDANYYGPFATLQGAFDACARMKNNQITISVQKDLTENVSLAAPNKVVMIDGGGNDFTGLMDFGQCAAVALSNFTFPDKVTSNNPMIKFDGCGTAILSDLDFTNSEAESGANDYVVQAFNTPINMSGCHFNVARKAINIRNCDGVKLDFEDDVTCDGNFIDATSSSFTISYSGAFGSIDLSSGGIVFNLVDSKGFADYKSIGTLTITSGSSFIKTTGLCGWSEREDVSSTLIFGSGTGDDIMYALYGIGNTHFIPTITHNVVQSATARTIDTLNAARAVFDKDIESTSATANYPLLSFAIDESSEVLVRGSYDTTLANDAASQVGIVRGSRMIIKGDLNGQLTAGASATTALSITGGGELVVVEDATFNGDFTGATASNCNQIDLDTGLTLGATFYGNNFKYGSLTP